MHLYPVKSSLLSPQRQIYIEIAREGNTNIQPCGHHDENLWDTFYRYLSRFQLPKNFITGKNDFGGNYKQKTILQDQK